MRSCGQDSIKTGDETQKKKKRNVLNPHTPLNKPGFFRLTHRHSGRNCLDARWNEYHDTCHRHIGGDNGGVDFWFLIVDLQVLVDIDFMYQGAK